MKMNVSAAIRVICFAAVFLGTMSAHSQQAATPAPADPQVLADSVAKEVAEIRGLPFKQHVGAEVQSTAQFGEYVSRQIDEVVPESVRHHYGKIVRTLGLYRGPPIDDFPR